MDTDAIYTTFTYPKVVTSLLVTGIGLGLALSVLMRFFWGRWFLPIAFAAMVLGTVILYLLWLDRQDIPIEQDKNPCYEQGQGKVRRPSIVIPSRLPVIMDPSRYTIFTNIRVITSMFILGISLGIALCGVIVLFRGTWYLPALVAILTMGVPVTYLVWLDLQDFSDDSKAETNR